VTDTAITRSKEDIEIFADHCVFMRSIYLHEKALFETSATDDRDRMSRTANIFFSDLNRVFIEYTILQVCKITDPAADFRKNDNHTIGFLLQHYDFSGETATLKRLNELNDKLLAFRAKLLPARNKIISHSDRNAIRAELALGAASDEEWNKFWLNLRASSVLASGSS
jgi:hypothetical protein